MHGVLGPGKSLSEKVHSDVQMLPRAPVFLLQAGPGRVTLGEYPSVSTSSQITTRSDAG